MTNNDINQISKLLDSKLTPIQNTLGLHSRTLSQHGGALERQGKVLDGHTGILENHSRILENHSKVLAQHGKILRSLKRDQNTMLGMLDGEQMKQKRRINRIEEHLGLQPSA